MYLLHHIGPHAPFFIPSHSSLAHRSQLHSSGVLLLVWCALIKWLLITFPIEAIILHPHGPGICNRPISNRLLMNNFPPTITRCRYYFISPWQGRVSLLQPSPLLLFLEPLYLSLYMTTIHLHGAHVTLCSVVRGCHKLILQHSLIRQTDSSHPLSPSTHHPQESERVRCAYHGRSEVGIPSIRVKGSFPIPGGTHRHTRESVSLSITNMVTYTWIYASQIWTGN